MVEQQTALPVGDVIKFLGLDPDKLRDMVVDKIVDEVMTTRFQDDEDDEDVGKSDFARRIQDHAKKAIDARVSEVCDRVVTPYINQKIDEAVLQETTQFGEKLGRPITFTEYIAAKADAYLQEGVAYNGAPVAKGSYNKVNRTRLVHMVHQHLQHAIEIGMQDAVKNLVASLNQSLKQQVQMAMQEVSSKVAVTFTGR